jgi:Animal haem peroxidase
MAHGMTEAPNTNPVDMLDWDGFDYMLDEKNGLSEDDFLSNGKATIDALKALGESMSPSVADGPGSPIPAPYTYLGQFIDHDITITVDAPNSGFNADQEILKPEFEAINRGQANRLFKNGRTSGFDLDSLYGLQPDPKTGQLPVPFVGNEFLIGDVTATGPAIPGKSKDNDLPRRRTGDSKIARLAVIGDPRNDENVIIAQLHLAFLKFHNSIVREGRTYEESRRLTVQHYQWLVLRDFLPKICAPQIVDSILEKGNRIYKSKGQEKFMPLEFSVAAYRFGHSMIRSTYDFNRNFKKVGPVQAVGTLDLMFQFTGKSGNLGGHATLPDNWIAEWELLMLDKALPIDTSLTPFLASLPGQGAPLNIMSHLAKRNLLRGYLFKLPIGQAAARILLPKTEQLTSEQLLSACISPAQQTVVKDGGFDKRTPLWFYVLAEAKVLGKDGALGPLGSWLVAETIIGLMRANPESILNKPFVPTLGQIPGRFDLQDLFMKAGVMSNRVA